MRTTEKGYQELIAKASETVRRGSPAARAASLAPPKRSVTDILADAIGPQHIKDSLAAAFKPARKKPGIRVPKRRVMNKGEAEYKAILEKEYKPSMGFVVAYEVFRFRLKSGAWYCPDFTIWLDGYRLKLVCEVKGSYRLGSAGRSHLAFLTAAEEWKDIPFRYAKREKSGEWTVTEINNPSPAARCQP